jgi:hypothetical protein
MENQPESVGNSFPLMAKNGGLVSSHFGKRLAGMVWSPAFSQTPWRPTHFPIHFTLRNKGHHGAPWGTMGHHGAPQVQQLLQELDTVNGTIRALDEAKRDTYRFFKHNL